MLSYDLEAGFELGLHLEFKSKERDMNRNPVNIIIRGVRSNGELIHCDSA